MKYTGINNYWIDDFGVVFNKTKGNVIKPNFNNQNGYLNVKLSDGPVVHTRYIHRLMCEAFNGKPLYDNLDVNHIDGNKLNNHYSNLEWCTRKYNIQHSHRLGLSNHKGSRNSQSILDELSVSVIKDCLKNGFNRKKIANYFKVHSDTVRSIENGKNWSHV